MKQTITNDGVGKWVPRKYDVEKAAGTLQFTDDLRFGPELLHARAARSTVAHGEILGIHTDEALKVDQHEHNKEMAEKQARSENFQTAFSDEGEEAK